MKDPAWPIRTYKPQYPPTFIAGGEIRSSVIGAGCSLSGCLVERSIIAPGVRIEAGAEVVDSILFEDVHVRRGARLRKVIIDKASAIPERFEAGFDADKDGRHFKISKTGIRVVPKGWTSE